MSSAVSESEAGQKACRPFDGVLFSLVFGLVVLGLVAIFSASFPKAMKSLSDGLRGDSFRYLRLQATYALIGFAAMYVLGRTRPEEIRRWSFTAFAIAFVLAGLTLTGLSIVRCSHGSCRWLQLGIVRIQPSEFAKLALIVYVACKLAEGRLNAANFRTVGVKVVAATVALCGLLFVQKDQGMIILILVIVLCMAYLGHLRGRYLAILTIGALAAAAVGIVWEEYRTKRVLAFLNPLKYRTESGWQILTMKTAIARGGIAGVGLGRCPEKFEYLPEPHTDGIFCVICSEMGLLGGLAVLILLAAVISRVFHIAVRARDDAGYFMVSGIAIMLAAQALINVGVATHLLPITGLTLPFVSYGGSSLVTCLAAIGVVMSVHRFNPPNRQGR